MGFFIIEYSHSSGGDTLATPEIRGAKESMKEWRDFSGAKGSLRD